MEARAYQIKLPALAKDPSDVLQCIIIGDPSRYDSPPLNHFAKPIPLAQSLDNEAIAG
jgi:hypothetical protein